jgi:histidinol-phosphate aminotransferase
MNFEVIPSAANFIFVRHARCAGAELAALLRDRGIIVRHFHSPARIAPYLRISIGTDAQCELLTRAIAEILSALAAASSSSALS